MIGQKRLLNQLSSLTFSTFPSSSLLIGERGSGKHEIVKEIERILGITSVDITCNITLESLSLIGLTNIPTLYIIDGTMITEREQNSLLKLLEEPSPLCKILILTESTDYLLETIINRCFKFYMDSYTREELMHFLPSSETNKDLALKLIKTPGQLKHLNYYTIDSLYGYCKTIVTKIKDASFSNTLSISNKINFKDNYDKYDLELFITILKQALFDYYITDLSGKIIRLYTLVSNFCTKISNPRVNREIAFHNLLTNL